MSRRPEANMQTIDVPETAAGTADASENTERPGVRPDRQTNVRGPNQLPSFWASLKARNASSTPAQGWRGHFKGWRIVVFHSWLNLFLAFVPFSWALSFMEKDTHNLIFAMCILSLVPLVKLHDLCTGELAIRIGGNKTGLLNASLSNMVEIVISISALRRCELSVVQSALVGSIMSKLLLVLGLCFFAGGLRFTEQGFDATATQMHTSLMSISVGAILLPAAYHFMEDKGNAETSAVQGKHILQMSHAVAIVLLLIYSAYLIFQLWSHKHLYHDRHNKQSERLPVQVRVGVPKSARILRHAGKRLATSFSTLDLSRPASRTDRNPGHPLEQHSHPSPYDSQLTLNICPDNSKKPEMGDYPEGSTVRLVTPRGVPLNREDTYMSNESSETIILDVVRSYEDLRPESYVLDERDRQPTPKPEKEPQLSWAITLCTMLTATTIVAFTAEMLVESMNGVSSSISKEWIECITAVNVSVRDELTLSVSVAVGSSIQTALFVFPFMVILGWIINKPLSLLLDPYQSLVLYLSVQIMSYVVADGKSNWLEGVILICLYVIVAVSFWFYPGEYPNRSSLPAALANCVLTISDPV
ncbi:hypothetical protein NP233_g1936 [Leucocoprinus birnbaumii]|uniref:Sodium/calcium exchanger membrane region domain-containing protein n=1 Tax=Leucocoprinus birnbaumii TaxID=56174 RepID=A0AAD5W166_9AGAR|nr:hypothetical protein NP233_g1936 [Leucocoprinus birnbaumii]